MNAPGADPCAVATLPAPAAADPARRSRPSSRGTAEATAVPAIAPPPRTRSAARSAARSRALEPPDGEAIFARAAERATEGGLDYAGAVTPVEAWTLLQAQLATLVDVRTAAEVRFVGRVPGTVHVEWTGGEVQQRAAFVQNLRAIARNDQPLLLLCRSGVRSHAAAVAATEAGFKRGYNVLEGFEGRIDPTRQRGNLDGWRFHRLPWVQD